MFASHTRFGPTKPDGRYALRTDDGDEFTADQVVIAAGSRAVIPDAIAECGVRYHTSDTIMRIADVPEHLVIVGGGFVACRVRPRLLGAGQPRDDDDPRQHPAARPRRRRSASGSPISPPKNGRSAATTRWPARARTATASSLRCDDGSSVRGDVLLVATGRTPNGDLLDAEQAGVEVTPTAR